MSNLYITQGNTTTTVGLSNSRITTPSLVVTCGNTTQYGALTTNVKLATRPNKLTVTYGNTTYYTRAPAAATRLVNFITPYNCPLEQGTVQPHCCSGLLSISWGIFVEETHRRQCYCDYGVIGPNNVNPYVPDESQGWVFSCMSDDTSTSPSYIYSSPVQHNHTVNVAQAFCYFPTYFHTNHLGVRISCNWNLSPNCIVVFAPGACASRPGFTQIVNKDYIKVNAPDSTGTLGKTCLFMVGCNPNVRIERTSKDDCTVITATDFCFLGNRRLQFVISNANDGYTYHDHKPYYTCNSFSGEYAEGYQLAPMFTVDMRHYDNNIDYLPPYVCLFAGEEVIDELAACVFGEGWRGISPTNYPYAQAYLNPCSTPKNSVCYQAPGWWCGTSWKPSGSGSVFVTCPAIPSNCFLNIPSYTRTAIASSYHNHYTNGRPCLKVANEAYQYFCNVIHANRYLIFRGV